MTIAAAAMAAGSFVWFAIGRSKQPSPDLLAARKAVAFSSLIPLVGAVITYATFMLASNAGGTYTVAYGLILIGLAAYVSSILRYIILARNTATALSDRSNTVK